MKKTIVSLLLLASALFARADITVTIAQCREVAAALNQLDGAEQLVPQGDGKPAKVVSVPYKLSADTRWKIADLAVALRDELAKAETARVALLKQSGADVPAPPPAAVTAYGDEFVKLIARPVKLKCAPLKRADLDLDTNAIPPGVLAALIPVTVP